METEYTNSVFLKDQAKFISDCSTAVFDPSITPEDECSSEASDSEEEEVLDADHDIRMMTVNAFRSALKKHGVPLLEYGKGMARNLRSLWVEVVLTGCKLERRACATLCRSPRGAGSQVSCTLHRKVRLVVLELKAIIDNEPRFLLVKDETPESGQKREGLHAPISLTMFPDEEPFGALIRLMVLHLHLCSDLEKQSLSVEDYSVTEREQESVAYPGLLTFYTTHKYTVHVQDSTCRALECIGLPSGCDFETSLDGRIANGMTTSFSWVSLSQFQEAVEHWGDFAF